MELTEPIEVLNARLKDHFGIDTITGDPMWRISWSNDQLFKMLDTYYDYDDNKILIRVVREVREIKKYPHIHDRYIIEHLCLVPFMNEDDMPDTKVSYECIHVFEDGKGLYLPPKWEITKFIIDLVHDAMHGTKNTRKYLDPDSSQEASIENRRKRIEELQNQLFGDETGLLGSTISGESVIVPGNYEKVKQ